jgi:transposase
MILVDLMKSSIPAFATMGQLTMQLRGIFRSRKVDKLDDWLRHAHDSGIHAMRRFARKVQSDLEAVRNAMREPWSNGPTEGLISRLKTLKRSKGGRAGIELLRARLLPLQAAAVHGK